MIVKFLAKSKTFKGVRYNTNKMEKDKGELMKVSGFGSLQVLSQLMPQDYINYLKMVSSVNKRVIYPQLHAVISAKGKETTAEELTAIAEKWLEKMGYAQQPYLIVFHKDTRNHHVHIVSTRVDKSTGKKISSAYEKIRAMTAINRIMKQDEKLMAKNDLERALKYNFQTKAQFKLILESKDYALVESDGKLTMIKFGKNLLETDLAFLKERKDNYQVNQARASQITAFIHKYRLEHSAELRRVAGKLPGRLEKEKTDWTSGLAEALHHMFGIQLIFHSSAGKMPYGYSVLDHYGTGNVFKGGEIMDIKDLLTAHHPIALPGPISAEGQNERKDLISKPHLFIGSSGNQFRESTIQQISKSTVQISNENIGFEAVEKPIEISISDDIDDEAIHGRNRHRKKQARTNSR